MTDLVMTPALWADIKMLLTTALPVLLEKLGKDREDLASEAAMQAVDGAVRAAYKEMFDRLHKDGVDLSEAVRKDVLAFLGRAELTEEIANHLLFRKEPDFDRLRAFYFSNGGATSERWETLEEPLDEFFQSLEDHLLADPYLGSSLQFTRKMRRLKKINDGVETVARINRRMAQAIERLEIQDRRQDDFWLELLHSHAEQTVLIGQQNTILEKILDEQQKNQPLPIDSDLTPAEASYLRELAADTDELPLALDSRGKNDRGVEAAELSRVYVDLATTQKPSLERVLDRLCVPDDDRPRAREAIRGKSEQAADFDIARGEFDPRILQNKRAFKKHPLRPWAKDAEELVRAFSPVTALEALAENETLVLLGDPGSGKSTLVNHVAHTFAQARLDERSDWRETTEHLFGQAPFPIRILLREWSANWHKAGGRKAFYKALTDRADGISKDRWIERLGQANTLVLLDGLDEVPTGDEKNDRRRQILEAVRRFRQAHPECRVVVTCRVKPYTDTDIYRLQGWPAFELAKLDEPRVKTFCERWYGEQKRIGRLSASEEKACRVRLLDALKTRPVLKDMAGTPILLTMLAKVNARSHLPEGRVELYEECVEQLLWEWEKAKDLTAEGKARKLDDLLQSPNPPLKRSDLERLLWQLTYEIHGESGKNSLDLPTDKLRKELARIHPGESWDWAKEVIELMQERSGLLIASSNEVFNFPHRSFQEYLAARGLLLENNRPVVAAEKADQDIWHEVILLACGHLATVGDFSGVQSIVQELISGQKPQEVAGARRILFAGQAWQEFGHYRRVGNVGEELHAKLPKLLTQAMQCSDLPARQRHTAGILACDLGDVPEELREEIFVELPEAWFGYPFKIGKYPVTNAQFRRFVEDGGYDREKGWISEEGWKQMAIYRSDLTQPPFWTDRDWNRETQPVVGVSWYEAEAYCKWLTERLRSSGKITANEVVRLPTFEERKKAAEGASGREFPWGNEEEVHRLNCEESQIGLISPVHMYPQGKTAEGIWDLSGNVWEWTADRKERFHPVFALGGGAWYKNISLNSSAARVWDDAGYWDGYVGFRVSFSPLLL